MKTIGLTGGIGSGKSTVAQLFAEKGIEIYNSDHRAKELMTHNIELKSAIQKLLGNNAYNDKELNRTWIASQVFNNVKLLQQLNELVHPKVTDDFTLWKKHQQGKFCIKEAAILFESNAYKQCFKTILVIASEEIRIQRVQERDGLTRDQILQRINKQSKQEELKIRADYILENDNGKELLTQEVEKLYLKILQDIET